MSIYRRIGETPDEVPPKKPDAQPAARTAAAAPPPDGKDPKLLRRGSPATVLVPPTTKWLETLPANVRPHALVRQFPRIANLIAAAWRDPKSFYGYMESLLHDKRGGRKGFPPEILHELVALQQFYEMRNKDDNSVWGDVGRRG
jgi:hypothetical protein